MTDARGKNTTTAYHAFYGYVTSVTNHLGHVTSSVSDPGLGVPTQLTDANSKVTTLQYDTLGRLQKVWLPSEPTNGAASLEFVYNLTAGAYPASVKSRQLQSGSSYAEGWGYVDGFGRELQSQSALLNGNRTVVSTKYNQLGQAAYSSAPYEISGAAGSGYVAPSWSSLSNYHALYYEELGNLWLDETKSGSSVLWSNTTIHDAWQKRAYNPRGNRTDYDNDGFGKLAKVTEYNVGSVAYNTTYAYDLQGNLTGVTDHLGNLTSMGYDLLGRKTAMTDPDMGSWQYQYDAVGNLTGQRDARNLWLYLGYDDLNRLVSKRKDNATTGALIADYSYDATGQKGLLTKSRAYNAAGTTVEVEIQSSTYDNCNRLTQQNWVVNGAGTFRMDSAFNAADQKTSVTYPGGTSGQSGEVVSYQYNAVSQLTGVTGVGGIQYVSSASYNAQGQMTQLVNEQGNGANGLTRQFVYNTNTLRLDVLKAGTSGAFENLQKLTYSYDNNGNVSNVIDTVNSSQKQCFQYDWLDRLTGAFTGDAACASYSATGTGAYNHSYTYNEVGNITSYAGNSYTYGDAAHKHAVTAAFGNTYGYDANGNQTTRTIAGVTYTFTYDYENRITAIAGGSVSATFIYDASGQRVKGAVGGVTTVYVAGVYEYQAGATTLYYEGNALRRTGYAADNGLFYNLRDHLSSSSALLNQNATVNGHRNYFFPFGGNRGGAAFSGVTTKRFTGQYHEAGLPGGEGLSYYNARWYDAQLGRFLSADTVVPGSANPQALNRYSYVKNNPAGRIDPTGHYDIKPGDAPYSNKPKPSSATVVTGGGSSAVKSSNPLVNKTQPAARVFYLNGLGGHAITPDPFPQTDEYNYLFYQLQQAAGRENVVHVSVFDQGFQKGWSHLEMLREAVGPWKPWGQKATDTIVKQLQVRPLEQGEQLVLVGSSAGGTVASEILPYLAGQNIRVNHLILRGSPVDVSTFTNVDRVSYIAADPPSSDHYWVFWKASWWTASVNPYNEATITQYSITGFHGHVPQNEDLRHVGEKVIELLGH